MLPEARLRAVCQLSSVCIAAGTVLQQTDHFINTPLHLLVPATRHLLDLGPVRLRKSSLWISGVPHPEAPSLDFTSVITLPLEHRMVLCRPPLKLLEVYV